MEHKNVDILPEETELFIRLPSYISERLPSDSIVIDSVDSELLNSIRLLKRQDVIGISLAGTNIGRHGNLEWLCISSSVCTYLFDMMELKNEVFSQGLKAILENKKIVKVFHDCRLASDHLFHIYNIELLSVFDTQIGDFVINAQTNKLKNISYSVNTLDYCLKKYLQITEDYLHGPFEDCYEKRPLGLSTKNLLIKNVIFLRALKHEQDLILRMPFRRCCDAYLNTLLLKSDEELKLQPPNMKSIPSELMVEKIMLFEIKEQQIFNDQKPSIHLETGRVDCTDSRKLLTERQQDLLTSGRQEIIEFLMDKMYSHGYPDRKNLSRASIFGEDDKASSSKIVDQAPSTCNESSIVDVRNISPVSSVIENHFATSKFPETTSVQIENKKNDFFKQPCASKNDDYKGESCNDSHLKTEQPFESLSNSSSSSTSFRNVINCAKALETDSTRKHEEFSKIQNILTKCSRNVESPDSSLSNSSQINNLLAGQSNSSISSKLLNKSSAVVETDCFRMYDQQLDQWNDWSSDENESLSESQMTEKDILVECSIDSEAHTPKEGDPWVVLRKAFSDLGPSNDERKLRFIPAGME